MSELDLTSAADVIGAVMNSPGGPELIRDMVREEIDREILGQLRDSNLTISHQEQLWVHLWRDFGIKLDSDFSFTYQYGELRILCHTVFRDRITVEAEKFGVAICEFYTWGG